MAKTYRLGPGRRAINVLFTAMIQAGIAGRSYYLLTTTGRRTGRRRTTPVTLVENPGERWLVSPYGNVSWVHNVRARPEVQLSRGNRTESLYAEEVAPELAGPILKQYVCTVPVTKPYFDATFTDPVQTFVREADRHPVFRLGPGPPG